MAQAPVKAPADFHFSVQLLLLHQPENYPAL